MEKGNLEYFISSIFEKLVNVPYSDSNLIRKHTCNLDEFGEVSFPIPVKNWKQFVNGPSSEERTIFSYNLGENDAEKGLQKLLEQLSNNDVHVHAYKIIKNRAHLFLDRISLYANVMPKVLEKRNKYDRLEFFNRKFILSCCLENEDNLNLTSLRLLTIKKVTENLLKRVTKLETHEVLHMNISANPVDKNTTILCGPVINETGIKEHKCTSDNLYEKRVGDVRKMFEHKYGKQAQNNTKLEWYFTKLGKACVTIELLTNKPHKPLKIDSKQDIESSKRGILFVFYNCARISTLFKEYEQQVGRNVYPPMPNSKKIDFSLLREPEEWELFYVFILQYPSVIKSCIKDIEKCSVSPQYLVTFLCSLSSVFSAYYRRVRILIDARDHLIPIIQARLCLLRALQYIFHDALEIFEIDPIKEM